MSRKYWPESWGADFAALLTFHSVRAIENGNTVILVGANNAAFAIVPVAIALGTFRESPAGCSKTPVPARQVPGGKKVRTDARTAVGAEPQA